MQPFAGIHGGFQLGGSAPEPSAVGSVEDATQWHHYAQSCNATDGRRVVYVDGVEVNVLDAAYIGQPYHGEVCLHFAIVHNDLEMVQVLVESG